MQSFQQLLTSFEQQFAARQFPQYPESLYDAAQYILGIGGKRVRPVCVLMGNELFNDIHADAYHVANAVELFHNFSLIHDDIMDKAPIRRGLATVHQKYGESTALLAGDVMLVTAYDHINKIRNEYLPKIISLFNETAKNVCEGQQMDMDFEKSETVTFEEYVEMITLKTSVLLASSLQMGAVIGGAGLGNQKHLYEFGKNLGIAFQIQDDYLDAFGDPEKFGKQTGGDILADKKTFLMIHALEVADHNAREEIKNLAGAKGSEKINGILKIYKDSKVDEWATELKGKYFIKAMHHLEEIAVLSSRKKELTGLVSYLMQREN